MQSQPINVTGMYGTILLHEDAGGYVLVAVISFNVAVVITALCIKFRKRGQKSQDAEDHVKERKGGKHEEKVISWDSGTCIVFYKYAPFRPYLRKNLLPKSGCSV